MKRWVLLFIAAIGNGLGSALMLQTDIGMSAWGAAAANMSLLFDISPGVAFIHISLWFYIIAIVLNKVVVPREMALSFLFLVTFSALLDGFLAILPDFSGYSMVVLILINLCGIFILLGSISLHFHVNLAVHPMDVFMKAVQRRFHHVAIGTYIAYGSAFLVAIVFGLIHGSIEHIGIGTVLILTLGGIIMQGYDSFLFIKLRGGALHDTD